MKAVALGADGIIEGAHPGLVFVDMSSIAPLVAREIHDALAEKGIPMLDAPVSGGEPKAIDGTLSVMVGGDEQVFDQVKDVLSAMAASVVFVGEIGAGEHRETRQSGRRRPEHCRGVGGTGACPKAGIARRRIQCHPRRTGRQHRARSQSADDDGPQLQTGFRSNCTSRISSMHSIPLMPSARRCR